MNFVTKEPINKGWSSDKKYCVTDENGTRYLLRVSDIAQHDTKQSEFNMMKQVASFGVPMCQPIEFGTCDEGVYSIQSWIDGDDAEEIMSAQSDTEQYSALFSALIFCGSQFIQIPLPFGYFNLGDCFIILSAVFIGGPYCVISSAIGSVMADVLSGYTVYVPATLLIKSAMAAVITVIYNIKKVKKRNISGLAFNSRHNTIRVNNGLRILYI